MEDTAPVPEAEDRGEPRITPFPGRQSDQSDRESVQVPEEPVSRNQAESSKEIGDGSKEVGGVRVVTESDPQPCTWAVCQRPASDSPLPEWFRDRDDAQHWQNEVVPVPSGYHRQITRKKQGWHNLLPIVQLGDLKGDIYAGRRFCEFLPFYEVSSEQATDLHADLGEIFAGRSPELECDLGEDWRFDLLQAEAAMREGHAFRGRKIESLSQQLVKIAYDLEKALQERLPDLPAVGVAAFWASWSVWQHVALWCPNVLREMVNRDRSARLLSRADESLAIDFVCRQFWYYAQEVKRWHAMTVESGGSAVRPQLALTSGANSTPPTSEPRVRTATTLSPRTVAGFVEDESVAGCNNILFNRPAESGNSIPAEATIRSAFELNGPDQPKSSAGPRQPAQVVPSASTAMGIDLSAMDFVSEAGRIRAIAEYVKRWKSCSEASLARTARVDPADLSKWKKNRLPVVSGKKARIELVLKNSQPPTPSKKRPKYD